MDKLALILIGYSAAATLVIVLLIKNPGISYEISKLIPKIKRNKGSNIKSDITPVMNIKADKTAKKGLFKRILTKKKKT